MKATARPIVWSHSEQGHPLVVGSTVVVAAVMGLAVKATVVRVKLVNGRTLWVKDAVETTTSVAREEVLGVAP